MAESTLARLFQRRFLFVTGKGGVGKTTIAAAIARALAASGKRVLVAASAEGEALGRALGVSKLPLTVEEVRPRLWAVRITLERALEEYGRLALPGGRLFEAVFANQSLQGFFRGVPGLSEWAILGKAWYHSTERLSDGGYRFDAVILDAPATGHGVGMLWVPKVVVEIAPVGILRRDAELALSMFRDPSQTGVVIATLPEEMPVNETLELREAIRSELGMPLGAILVNLRTRALFEPPEREGLEGLVLDPSRPVDQVLALGRERALVEKREALQVERLSGLGVEVVNLPRIQGAPSDDAVAAELALILAREGPGAKGR